MWRGVKGQRGSAAGDAARRLDFNGALAEDASGRFDLDGGAADGRASTEHLMERCRAAQPFAPDYDVEAIYDALQCSRSGQ